MLTLIYDDYQNNAVAFRNEAPYYFLSQQGCDGTDAAAILAKAPYQRGKTRLGANIEPRVITVKCCLVTDSAEEFEARRAELLHALNPLKPGRLTVIGKTFHRQFSNTQVTDAPVFDDKNYNSPDGITYFSFSLMAPGNFIEDAAEAQATLMEAEPSFSFILEFADEIIFGNMSVGRVIFNNDGDVETPLIIEIPGPVQTPMITNETTGEYIRVHTPILANEVMTINTAFGEKSVVIRDDAGNARNAFHYIDIQSSFFQLVAGENSLRFRAEEGNDTAEVTVRFRRLYLGI